MCIRVASLAFEHDTWLYGRPYYELDDEFSVFVPSQMCSATTCTAVGGLTLQLYIYTYLKKGSGYSTRVRVVFFTGHHSKLLRFTWIAVEQPPRGVASQIDT